MLPDSFLSFLSDPPRLLIFFCILIAVELILAVIVKLVKMAIEKDQPLGEILTLLLELMMGVFLIVAFLHILYEHIVQGPSGNWYENPLFLGCFLVAAITWSVILYLIVCRYGK